MVNEYYSVFWFGLLDTYLYVICSKPVRNIALGVDGFSNLISDGKRDSHSVNCRWSASRDIPFMLDCRGRYCVETIARTSYCQ